MPHEILHPRPAVGDGISGKPVGQSHEVQPAEPAMKGKPKLRWYQLSLRGLLLATGVICPLLAWLAYERNEVQKQEAAIAAIKKLGGYAEFSEEKPSRPDWLRTLLGDKSPGEVVKVGFTGSPATDADLSHIAGLTELTFLNLEDSPITDAGLIHLKNLTKLKLLILDGTQVTDAGVVHLADLAELEQLKLNETQVSDAGLVNLKKLSNLRYVNLRLTQVTDAGLVNLAGLTKLELLDVHSTKVTYQGVWELQQVLPNVEIRR